MSIVKENIMSYNKDNKNNKNETPFMCIWLSFIGAAIIPLFVELVVSSAGLAQNDWFSSNDTEYDFFLICKMISIIAVAAIMLCVIVWQYNKRSNIYISLYTDNKIILVSMGVYIVLALLSACLADNVKAAFLGGYAQHEPFTVLFGYIIFAIFSYMFISGSKDMIRFLRYFMWGVAVISLIGVLQFLAMDFFNTDMGKSLITMFSDIDASRISLSFGEGRVYMTLYNPNYVGSYVALVIPVMIAGVFVMERLWEKTMMGITALMLVICLIGSASTTGMSAIALSIILLFILCIPRFRTYGKYIGIMLAGALAIIVFVCIVSSDRIKEAIDKYTLTEDVRLLTGIELEEDEVKLIYKDKEMYVTGSEDESGNMLLKIYDENHSELPFAYNAETGLVSMDDEVYRDISFGVCSLPDGDTGFNIICGSTFTLTHDTGDGKYYFYNPYGKKTRDIVNSRRFGFEGHESFASNRGFIWSRSIPLLADNIIYGCGPDNFVSEFPNNDYVSLYNNTYQSQVVTRPHNMYLQIGVQTGVISLVAFLVMYVVYFIQSVRLLWACDRINTAYIISMSILVGSFGYMICGLANDSTLGVAPVFWIFIGLGLAGNRLLKRENPEHIS